jgi:putative intracellular protease/amidase
MKRIAMVLSTVGYHWEEAFAAYRAFRDARFDVQPFTVDGQPPTPDPYSLAQTGPLSLLGLGVSRRISPKSRKGHEFRELVARAQSVNELRAADFDALYLPGGHGCLFDVNRNPALHACVRELYGKGAILGAVCHATSTFAFVTLDGKSIVHGHALTGFPDPLDRMLIKVGAVHERFLPLPLVNDDELRKAGAKLSRADVAKAMFNPSYMRVSPPFVTGTGPKAARRVAQTIAGLVGTQREGLAEAERAAPELRERRV